MATDRQTDRQTNEQTNKQMDITDRLTRSRCREWRLNKWLFVMLLPIGKGAVSVAFVHPFVAYNRIIRESKGLACPNLEGRFLRYDSRTSFKVKRSKVRVTRPINADTHRAPYLANAKAYGLTAYRWCPQANTNLQGVSRKEPP